MAPGLPTVREDPTFSATVHSLTNAHPRLREVVDDVMFVIARQPLHGDRITNFPDHYVFATSAEGATPQFWVLYKYDLTQPQIITLVAITVGS